LTQDDVDAYWLGTAQAGMSGMVLAKPLGLEASR
jgi:acetyl-CoA C-acetyltransferase